MDLNQLAKRLVDEATGEEEKAPEPKVKDSDAVEKGRLGGLKGGKSRASSLTTEQRSNIAKIAAAKRWEG